MNDITTFFLAFGAVFGLLAAYLFRLERRTRAVEAALQDMAANAIPEAKSGTDEA